MELNSFSFPKELSSLLESRSSDSWCGSVADYRCRLSTVIADSKAQIPLAWSELAYCWVGLISCCWLDAGRDYLLIYLMVFYMYFTLFFNSFLFNSIDCKICGGRVGVGDPLVALSCCGLWGMVASRLRPNTVSLRVSGLGYLEISANWRWSF